MEVNVSASLLYLISKPQKYFIFLKPKNILLSLWNLLLDTMQDRTYFLLTGTTKKEIRYFSRRARKERVLSCRVTI